MKISKIEILNFRCFKGKQVVEFSTDGKITFIYGLSGSGKTTLLKFINWIFYNEYRSGIYDHLPMYNIHLDQEIPLGSTFVVEGKIDFIHAGTEYQIIRGKTYIRILNRSEAKNEYSKLLYKKENGSWVDYPEDADEKINEIIPKALSRYFFFHGEIDPGVVGKNSSSIRDAIYLIFGLDAFDNAIKHLGDKISPQSLINIYARKRSGQKKGVNGSALSYLDNIMKVKETITKYEGEIAEKNKELEEIENERNSLLVKISNAQAKTTLEADLNYIAEEKKNLESLAKTAKNEIGEILYRSAPYMLLESRASSVKAMLVSENTSEKSYKGLTKDLLVDLKSSEVCLCGRHIDDISIHEIDKLLNSMPPKSYISILNDFERNVNSRTHIAKEDFNKIELKNAHIAQIRNFVFKKTKEENDIFEDLKEYQKIKPDVERYEYLKNLYNKRLGEKANLQKEIERRNKYITEEKKKYEEASKSEKGITIIDEKIEILEYVKSMLEKEFIKKQKAVVETLENSVVEVYKQLSTRVEEISGKFITADFSLRRQYNSGGQEVIDIYSYIIGMIKAVKEVGGIEQSDVEFPIIIDAPFSKTDFLQLNHVISVLPKIASQVALFSFDIERVKANKENSQHIGKFCQLKYNNDQSESTIQEGDYSAI